MHIYVRFSQRPAGAEDLSHLRNFTAPNNVNRPTGPEGTASTVDGMCCLH